MVVVPKDTGIDPMEVKEHRITPLVSPYVACGKDEVAEDALFNRELFVVLDICANNVKYAVMVSYGRSIETSLAGK